MPTTTGSAADFITFSRASLATVTDADGKLKWAPHNLLSNSESFDGSSWGTTGGVTVTGNSTSAPNSTTTADTLAFTTTGFHYQGVSIGSAITGLTMTGSVWLWSLSGKATISLRLSASTTGTDQAIQVVTLTSTPTLYTVTRTFTSSDTGVILGLDNRTTQGGDGIAGNVIAWGAHLYRSDLGGMQANTSAYPFYNPTTPKNFISYTEDFSNAAWTKLGITVTAPGNQAVAPNGLSTADLAVVNNGPQSPSQLYQQLPGGQVSTTMTLSGYVKKSGASYASIGWIYSAGVYCAASFNLDTQTLTRSAALGGFTIIGTPSITALDDGWFRISITATTPATAAFSIFPGIWPRVVPWTSGNPDAGDTGNGTSGIYVWGAQLSNSASVDPYSSNGFAAPATGAYHGPRRDFDPVTLACRGLLVEEQRTNLALKSNDFTDGAVWFSGGASVSATGGTAPDGTNNANVFTMTAAGAYTFQNINVTSGVATTFSMWVKGVGSSIGKTGRIWFWYAGTATGPSAIVNFTLTSSWQRVSTTSTPTGNGSVQVRIDPEDLNAATAGDVVHLYGAQVETGAFATSYIPTVASAVDRSQDIAYLAASAFPYSTTEGSFVVNCTTLNNGPISVGRRPFSFDQDGTVFFQIGATYVYDDSTFRVAELAVTPGKHGVAVKTNDFAVVANAGAARTGTGAFTGNQYNILRLGRDYSGLNYLNGHVRQITYIPRRLTNAELQTRTT